MNIKSTHNKLSKAIFYVILLLFSSFLNGQTEKERLMTALEKGDNIKIFQILKSKNVNTFLLPTKDKINSNPDSDYYGVKGGRGGYGKMVTENTKPDITPLIYVIRYNKNISSSLLSIKLLLELEADINKSISYPLKKKKVLFLGL